MPHIGAVFTSCAMVCSALAFLFASVGSVHSNQLGFQRLTACARTSLHAATWFAFAACLSLAYCLITLDFRLTYVARNVNSSTPIGYVLTSLWAGQDGSLLWMSFLLSAFSSGCIHWMGSRHLTLQPYVIACLTSVIAFFFSVTLLAANPFDYSLASAPVDGSGLNPLLQNVYMVVHPPVLYIGFVACTIPFGLVVAGLISGSINRTLFAIIRKWILIAWVFLTLGNALGMIWAYTELGWGGYWAWDPVENASLLPWITATAAFHCVAMSQKYGTLKLLSVVSICITFWLTIFASFLSRSGLIASVHAFAKSDLGLYFLYYLIALVIATTIVIFWRRTLLQVKHVSFPSARSSHGPFYVRSIVGAVWLLLIFAGVVGIVTVYPIISEVVSGQPVALEASFYNSWVPFIGFALLFMIGIVTLFPLESGISGQPISIVLPSLGDSARFSPIDRLRKYLLNSLKSWTFPCALSIMWGGFIIFFVLFRNKHPWADSTLPESSPAITTSTVLAILGWILAVFNVLVIAQKLSESCVAAFKYTPKKRFSRALLTLISPCAAAPLAHLGVTILFVGLTGQSWNQSQEISLAKGQTTRIGDYSIRYQGLRIDENDKKTMYVAELEAFDSSGNNDAKHLETKVASLNPAKFLYHSHPFQPTSEVSVYSTLLEDLYVVLGNINAPPEQNNSQQQNPNNPSKRQFSESNISSSENHTLTTNELLHVNDIDNVSNLGNKGKTPLDSAPSESLPHTADSPYHDRVSLQLHINPLVSWVWTGLLLMVAAAVIALRKTSGFSKRLVKTVPNVCRTFLYFAKTMFSRPGNAVFTFTLIVIGITSIIWNLAIGLVVACGTAMLFALWNLYNSFHVLVQPSAKVCLNCHTRNDCDALFCKHCGQNLTLAGDIDFTNPAV